MIWMPMWMRPWRRGRSSSRAARACCRRVVRLSPVHHLVDDHPTAAGGRSPCGGPQPVCAWADPQLRHPARCGADAHRGSLSRPARRAQSGGPLPGCLADRASRLARAAVRDRRGRWGRRYSGFRTSTRSAPGKLLVVDSWSGIPDPLPLPSGTGVGELAALTARASAAEPDYRDLPGTPDGVLDLITSATGCPVVLAAAGPQRTDRRMLCPNLTC